MYHVLCSDDVQVLPEISVVLGHSFRDEHELSEALAQQRLAMEFNKLAERLNKSGYPDLALNHFVNLHWAYPHYGRCPHRDTGVHEIPVAQVFGDNWAHRRRYECPGYPKPPKLRDILIGFLGIQLPSFDNQEMPPISVLKIMDRYHLDDGNHRYYASLLLGRQTILAEVTEYDYPALIRESVPVSSRSIRYHEPGRPYPSTLYLDRQQMLNYLYRRMIYAR